MTTAALDRIGKIWVREMKKNIRREKKVASGYLLNSIGYKLGMIYAISNDFDSIEKDILNSDPKTKSSKNLIINLGIQESFVLYMETKSSFIEECMKLNLFTHTLKEVVDLFEEKVDKCLEQSSVDMKSTYSSFSQG